jgi:hypothetical protein
VSSLNVQINTTLIDSISHPHDGMLTEGYSESALCAAGAINFPASLLIDRSEWDDWINLHDKNKSSAHDFSARFTHQGNSHECVCHASTQSFEIAYNRQFAGTKHAVYFSPLALYTRITGGRQWGGSNVNDALRELMSRGAIPEHDGPEWLGGKGGQVKRFKFTVNQTAGRSEDHWPTKGFITESKFAEGWEKTARHFRATEAFYIGNSQQHFSALLRGLCVVNGRSGHSIPHVKVVKSNGKYLSMYRDSYNEDRYDSEGMTGGGFAIAVVTNPDDPTKPAGADMKEASA